MSVHTPPGPNSLIVPDYMCQRHSNRPVALSLPWNSVSQHAPRTESDPSPTVRHGRLQETKMRWDRAGHGGEERRRGGEEPAGENHVVDVLGIQQRRGSLQCGPTPRRSGFDGFEISFLGVSCTRRSLVKLLSDFVNGEQHYGTRLSPTVQATWQGLLFSLELAIRARGYRRHGNSLDSWHRQDQPRKEHVHDPSMGI
ncbi:unnamed protein product [Gadus morhua 'NCC']